MRQLGTVKNIIHDGAILVSAPGLQPEQMPAPGTRIYDQRGGQVGKVVRVFGPVKEPYVTLRAINQSDSLGLLGASLYFGPEEQSRPQRTRPAGRRAGRNAGPYKKKGVNRYRRKENPRKK